MYENVKFFKNKDNSFITWVSALLRPMSVEELKYIYTEGEYITESNEFKS